MSVTLQQIADRASVSQMTVSKVLNGSYEPTRKKAVARVEKIKRLADEMGYRPNAAAKATRQGRFGSATMVLSIDPVRSTIFGGMLAGIHDALAERGLHLSISRLPDSELTDEARLPMFLREACSDGLLINYTDAIPARMVDIVGRYKIPAIWMNSRQASDCVYYDDLDAGYRATRHLLAMGHRRIAFSDYSHGLAYPQPHYSVLARRQGYGKAMAEAGLSQRVIQGEGENVHGSQRIAFSTRLLSGPDRPTAVIGYGNTDIIPWVTAAAAMGLSVPRDLSLLNFSDVVMDIFGPRLTTMVLPEQKLGRLAVEMLLEKIEVPGASVACRTLNLELEPGGTCVPPAGA